MREIREQLGVKSDAQIIEWVKRAQQGESFDDQRGVWNRKNFNSLEEENAYLKAQVEYLKSAIQIYTGRNGPKERTIFSYRFITPSLSTPMVASNRGSF